MMRCVRQASCYHPGVRSSNVEERRDLLPPRVVSLPEALDAPGTVLGVPCHEFDASLMVGEWRRPDINAEHGPEPGVLADALMHHVFMNAAAAWVVVSRSHAQV